MAVRLLLLGKPGSGKGTQAGAVASRYGVPAISTGDLIRASIREDTELGREFSGYTSQGALVPDELVLRMVQVRLDASDCADGFLLDGFPRTLPQAEALEELLQARGTPLDAALLIEVPEDLLIRRATGRRYCAQSGKSYHVEFNPPSQDGVCNVSGLSLIQRDDDREEVVIRRLAEYTMKTAPLVEYYRSSGRLRVIAGVGSVEEVGSRIASALMSLNR